MDYHETSGHPMFVDVAPLSCEYIYSEIVPGSLSTTQLHDSVMAAGKPMIAFADR